VKQLLASYEPPALDPAKDEELADFMARRKAGLANRISG
jgi:trimethylamine:corrinoid methyltransferase-like protein